MYSEKALAHRNLHQFDGPSLVVWPEDNSPGAHGNVTDDALCPKAHRVEVPQAAVIRAQRVEVPIDQQYCPGGKTAGQRARALSEIALDHEEA